jgi:hypothetical protein
MRSQDHCKPLRRFPTLSNDANEQMTWLFEMTVAWGSQGLGNFGEIKHTAYGAMQSCATLEQLVLA